MNTFTGYLKIKKLKYEKIYFTNISNRRNTGS